MLELLLNAVSASIVSFGYKKSPGDRGFGGLAEFAEFKPWM